MRIAIVFALLFVFDASESLDVAAFGFALIAGALAVAVYEAKLVMTGLGEPGDAGGQGRPAMMALLGGILAQRAGFEEELPTTEELFEWPCLVDFKVGGLDLCINRVVILEFVVVALVAAIFLIAFRKPKVVPRARRTSWSRSTTSWPGTSSRGSWDAGALGSSPT